MCRQRFHEAAQRGKAPNVFLLVLALTACAHQAPAAVAAAPTPRTALPLAIVVGSRESAQFDDLLPPTEKRARERFEAQGHAINGDGDLVAEIEIAAMPGGIYTDPHRQCARLQGRLVRRGQRFAAVDVVKERCGEQASNPEHGFIPLPRPLDVLVDAAFTVRYSKWAVTSGLLVRALEDLVDELGRQASTN